MGPQEPQHCPEGAVCPDFTPQITGGLGFKLLLRRPGTPCSGSPETLRRQVHHVSRPPGEEKPRSRHDLPPVVRGKQFGLACALGNALRDARPPGALLVLPEPVGRDDGIVRARAVAISRLRHPSVLDRREGAGHAASGSVQGALDAAHHFLRSAPAVGADEYVK